MRFKHTFKNYALLCGGVVIVLLAVYGTLVLATKQNPQPNPISVSSSVNCAFADKTFCSTDQLIRSYVSSKDYSDILENQIPVTVKCVSKVQAQQYCNGVQNNQDIQLFKVVEGQNSQLLSRNNYIDFFRTYFTKYGPYSFAGDQVTGSDVTMTYENTTQTAKYVLTFVKPSTQWKIAYVSISAP